MRFAVLRGIRTVGPFVDAVRQHADSDKNALGFFPEAAYREAAVAGKLLVAVRRGGNAVTYAGHLLFGGTYPHVHVFQVYVLPKYRGRHIGSLLIETVVKDAEERSYLSVSARVAADLINANAFWERQGFRILRAVRGGATRQRRINIRIRELDTPTLFGTESASRSVDHMVLASKSRFQTTPAYVIDVNVFLDLMKSRANADGVRQLMAASWTRAIDVFVSEEFVDELRRARVSSEPDPVFEFASALPRLPRLPEKVQAGMVASLAPIVFPHKFAAGTLSQRDESDLIHIATGIHHEANGFITGEKGILKHATDIRLRFGLDVVGTSEFVRSIAPTEQGPASDIRIGVHGEDLALWEFREEDRQGIGRFLRSTKVPDELVHMAMSPGCPPLSRRRLVVQALDSPEIVGFASWDRPTRLRSTLDAFVFVDEAHVEAEPVAEHLTRELLRDVAGQGLSVVTLKTPEGHARARGAAIDLGFRRLRDNGASDLEKIVLGGAVTPQQWRAVGANLLKLTGIEWSDEMPVFQGPNTPVSFGCGDGKRVELPLSEIERLFGPVFFLLPGRAGVLVPIRSKYAEHLFMGAPQMSLLPRGAAALASERVYFRSPDRTSLFSCGSPLLFYESLADGGRGCAIVAAVVTSQRIVWADTLSNSTFVKGAIEPNEIQKFSRNGLISVMRFGNILDLPRPIPFHRLRSLRAVDGANLVAPLRLDTSTLISLFTEAGALAL